MVHELASLEKEKIRRGRRKKENDDFLFFQILFLGFHKAELKSEDIRICTQEGQG